MKLLMIYGPPAAGKLTVGKLLSSSLGFKLFHNHLTRNLADSIFDHRSDEFAELNSMLRLETVRFAATRGVPGMIFTFCYSSPEDDGFVQELHRIMAASGGELLPVRLICAEAELTRRVECSERKELRKIVNPEVLADNLRRWRFERIPAPASLEIDNTSLRPEEVADRIKRHFGLA